MKQKAKLAQEQAVQEGTHHGKKSSHRRKISRGGKKVIVVAAVAAAVCLAFVFVEKRSYHSYKVFNTSEQEDVPSLSATTALLPFTSAIGFCMV